MRKVVGPMTKVAIIMRTFERPVLLARAIASVQQQTFTDWQLVVVNNGGDPAVVDKVVHTATQRTLRQTGTILVIHLQERVGMEAASNRGLEATESDYFAIHDDDDSWHPDFLATTVARLDADPSAAGVVVNTTRVIETLKGDRVWPVREEPYLSNPGLLTYRGLLGGNTFAPIAALFRRSTIDAVGPFDESLPVLGDWEFNLRAVRHGVLLHEERNLARYHWRSPESDPGFGNTVTDGIALHNSVRLQLQDRWLNNPEKYGQSTAGLSIIAGNKREVEQLRERIAHLENILASGAIPDVASIARETAHIIEMRRPWRRVLRSIVHPGHGFNAIRRRLTR